MEDESLKAYVAFFNRERMTVDDQDKKITLEALLRAILPRNPFIIELARKSPATLCELMDKADNFVNLENTLRALTAPRRSVVEQLEEWSRKGALKRDWGRWSKDKEKLTCEKVGVGHTERADNSRTQYSSMNVQEKAQEPRQGDDWGHPS